MTERRVPRIRFKGFEEDWEQRKLGEIGTVMTCRRIFKNQTSESGEIPFYKIGTFGGVADAFITRDLFEEYRLKYPFPEKGDVLISASGSIGRTVEYTGEEAYFQDSNIVWFNHDESVIDTFLRNVYEVIKWSGVEGSTIKRLYNDNILRTGIKIPTISEQEKIARFLDGFDMLLSLHQRKLEKLKILKKAMLEKMFPKKGAKVPEIRFSGFADDWEQRKLGEMAVISTGYPFNSNEFSPEGKYLVITNGNIQDSFTNVDESVGNRITLLDRKILDSYILDIGDILITMDGTVGRTAKVAGNGLILAQRVGRVKPIGNTEFMYQALSTGDFSKAMTELSHGGTIKHISLNEISLFEFKSPVREREQNTVGKFLYLFDSLLSLHQRKLEKLRQIKKSMLERMFV